MIMATMLEAKTNLSELVRQARNGETVIITLGREKTPVARLEAVEQKPKKRLGARLNLFLPGIQTERCILGTTPRRGAKTVEW